MYSILWLKIMPTLCHKPKIHIYSQNIKSNLANLIKKYARFLDLRISPINPETLEIKTNIFTEKKMLNASEIHFDIKFES